jgi:hypothetical protein
VDVATTLLAVKDAEEEEEGSDGVIYVKEPISTD